MNSTKTPNQPVNKAKPCLLEFTAVTEDTTLTESSVQFSSVTQSCPTLCDPHGSQHARPPCPSPTPGVHSDSRPSSQ